MFPLLQPGDEVLVNPRAYQQTQPVPGDIVVAQHPAQADLQIIKRVAEVGDDGRFHLKGDNPDPTQSSDVVVPRALILGRVTSRFG